MMRQPAGHLSNPASGPGPGVLVLHAWWGLNETIRQVCRRLADAGYTAFAPDLYEGKVTTSILEAEVLSGSLDPARARATVADAAGYLAGQTAGQVPGLSVIGYSLGAYFALEAATAVPDLIRGVVLFYGSGGLEHRASRAAYLGHFAEQDPFEPADAVQRLERSLEDAGRPVVFHTYPGTGHWFAEPDRTDAYDRVAAALAWERTLAFLQTLR